jgi:polyhydroxybutyrate depolymerase
MGRSLFALFVVGLAACLTYAQDTLGPGDHTRTLMMGEQKRTCLVHVPKDYDPKKPTPVVLALHGAAMNGSMMVWFSGLNTTADKSASSWSTRAAPGPACS